MGKRIARTEMLREALESLPREQWAASNVVGRAYLDCPKLAGILKHLGFKYRIPESVLGDVMQHGWFILVRQFPTLDSPENVYSFMYAVVENTMRSIRNKGQRTEHLRSDEEEADEEQAVRPLAEFDHGAQPDHSSQVISEVDLAKAQKSFMEKLAVIPIPSDIIMDASKYGRIGRPRKEDALQSAYAREALEAAADSDIESLL